MTAVALPGKFTRFVQSRPVVQTVEPRDDIPLVVDLTDEVLGKMSMMIESEPGLHQVNFINQMKGEVGK